MPTGDRRLPLLPAQAAWPTWSGRHNPGGL